MAILTKRTSGKTASKVSGAGFTPSISSGMPNLTSSSKPLISTRSAPTSIVTSPSTTTRPKLKSSAATQSPSISKVINALTGATLGVGAKSIFDKITAKPTAKPVAKPSASTAANKPPPVTSKVLTEQEVQAELDKAHAMEEPLAMPEGAVKNSDGTYSVTEDGRITTYSADGSILSMKAANNTTPEYYQDTDGNYYTMNASGGYDLAYYADGTAVSDSSPKDTTASEDSWTDPDTGAEWNYDGSMWTLKGDVGAGDQLVADNANYVDNTDYAGNTNYDDSFLNELKRGGLITMMKNGGNIQGYAHGGDVEYNDNGNGTSSYFDNQGDYVTVNNESGDVLYRQSGDNLIDPSTQPNESITNVGGGDRPAGNSWLDTVRNFVPGLSKETFDKVTEALPAAGAGALVASLLGANSGGGGLNQGLDMSKVGVINPRTTSFGVGPTNFVGYDQYGTSDGNYTPNKELLHNLNAPGFNPVIEGDYAPKMASGGLSSMSTPVSSYYTFGQPADIMANLGMRPQPPQNPPDMMSSMQSAPKYPTVAPQSGGLQSPLAQQAPQNMGQQQNPQGMPPQMARGGLPHVSNVPMTQGRMDFRQGSAVHGQGDGQSDDIPAMLADGEYVIDAETVAQIGNGSTKAGAQALDRFREGIRAHKRAAPINKIPPKTRALTSYLKG